MGLTRLLILCVPFRVVRRLLGFDPRGDDGHEQSDSPDVLLTPVQRARADRIGLVVQVAAQHTPWRSECYPQALTARILLGLRKIPHRVSFGLRRDGDRLAAHAWVTAGGTPVVGGDGRDYTEVASFVWDPAGRHA
ncbi:MAG: lasso peptide biosynthesis B2 protein [Nocardioidaceae bacterium]|nr:lasso peptide biosynthesis B2 protein [Nocardioidaceae bacterium]